MTGKLADTVMAVRNGEQLARKYQPIVANPNSPAQVAVRAKLKLLSQMSAVMAPVIAMPRVKSASSRNLFVKENYGAITYSDNTASVDLLSVKITKGVVSLPDVEVAAGTDVLNVSIQQTANVNFDRVVYVAFRKMDDETLRLAGSVVSNTPGSGNSFAAEIPVETFARPFVIYAYGVRDNNENARVIFGNMTVPTALSVAKVITTRTLTENDITLTETRAVEFTPTNP